MADQDITPILYGKQIIYFYQSDSHKWFIDEVSLVNIFNIDKKNLSNIQAKLEKGKHFIIKDMENITTKESGKITLWSRKGIIKVAYLLNSPTAFDVADNLEDIELKKREPIFGEIENILQEKLVKIKKDGSFADIEIFIRTFSKFIKEKEKKDMGIKTIFLELFEDVLKTAHK